jgi:hypothetical protein
MSYFSVCVAIPGDKFKGRVFDRNLVESILENIMAPYKEPPAQEMYVDFVERPDAKDDYETETTTAIRFPDGQICASIDPKFAKHYSLWEGKILEKRDGTANAIETDESRQLSVLQEYPIKKLFTFEAYCEDYCGYVKNEEGQWGYWTNPNAQWDWYTIGWSCDGLPQVKKENAAGCLISADSLDDSPELLYADAARKGVVAWAEMREKKLDEAKNRYKKLRECFEHGSVRNLGPLTVMTERGIECWGDVVYFKDETLEEFCTRTGNGPGDQYALSFYAYVDLEGKWHSRGDMGWFGISSNDKEERVWHDEVQEFLGSLGDDDYLVIVNCHI